MKNLSKFAGAAVGAAVIYRLALDNRVRNWGSTSTEADAALPGDELLPDADGVSTRAVWIAAPASAVWPWLAQMGPAPRGGAYTYDWIENLLGLNMHSSDSVIEEFQHPRLGDTIEFGSNKMELAVLDPERSFAWRSGDGNWVWSFNLSERGERTRLVSRNRYRLPRFIDRVGGAPMIPASLIMERKMLLNIKALAEHLNA